jgi:hypothetical protein
MKTSRSEDLYILRPDAVLGIRLVRMRMVHVPGTYALQLMMRVFVLSPSEPVSHEESMQTWLAWTHKLRYTMGITLATNLNFMLPALRMRLL